MNKTPTVAAIIEAVCAEYGCQKRALLSDARHSGIVRPRHVAQYLACDLTTQSLPQIGRLFNRDHTSIAHGKKEIAYHIDRDPILATRIDRIKTSIPRFSTITQQIIDVENEAMRDMPFAMGNTLRAALLRLPNADPHIVLREVTTAIERIKEAHRV